MTDQIAPLVRRYRELAGASATIAEEQDAIKAKLLELLHVGDVVDVDGEDVSVRPANRAFDEDAAAKILWARSPDVLVACEVRKWDAKKLRAALTGDELDQVMVRKSDKPIIKF